MAELKLSEELLLLSQNIEKKSFASNSSTVIKYGLAAAIIFELIELEKYTAEGENLKQINTDATGDLVIDLALKTLTQSENKLRNLMAKLSGKSKKFKELLINSLLEKQIIKKEPGSKDQFRLWYEKPWQHIKLKLNDIILYEKEGDTRSLTMIAILHACQITQKVFKEENIDQKKMTRIKELVEENLYYKAIKKSVKSSYIHILFTFITLVIMLLKELCSK
jgi:hypothetical protein